MEETKNYQSNEKVQKNRWLILTAVGLFTLMSTLDASIVNIALPVIKDDLKIPMNQTEWIVSIYLMVVCACLLLFGKIGDKIGKIRVFKIGTLVFVVGSLLCGLPFSLESLLFARIVQAVGASMTMSTNSGIITEIFPIHERGRALGLIGSFVSLGSIAGPGVGGLILAHFDWSLIFLINVPVGIGTMILGAKFLPKDLTKTGKSIDYLGFATFAMFILLFFGGIFIGQEVGFGKLIVLGLIIFSMISLFCFYRIEKTIKNPLLPFSIFKNKKFTMGLITAMLIFVANFFSNVLLPFYFINARGESSGFSGLLMMVFPLVMVVAAPLSGMLTDKIGPNILMLTGLGVLTFSQFVYMFMDKSSPIALFILGASCLGLGNALFQSPNNTVVMSSVKKDELGIAGSLNSLARNFGMVVGVSIATTILYHGMSFKMGEKVTTYITGRPDVFIFGMRVTYFVSFLICLLAFLLTAFRTRQNEPIKKV